MKKHKRSFRNYVIEPFKQVKFGIYILVICTAFLLCSVGLIFYSFVKQYEHVMGMFNVVDPDLQWELIINDVFIQNGLYIISLYFIFIASLMSTVFILTHRIYGPLVNINRFIKEVENGNYSCRVSLRKKDELKELAFNLNKLAESLEKRHGTETEE